MHSFTLRTTSEFFKDMLSLPRTENEDGVVQVDEGSDTLLAILRMIGGMGFQVPESEDALMSIILAAHKYGMSAPLDIVKSWMSSPKLPTFNPLCLYDVASHIGDQDLEAEGLRRSLELDIWSPSCEPYLKRLDATALFDITKLCRVRVTMMHEFFDRLLRKGSSKDRPAAEHRLKIPVCQSCNKLLRASLSESAPILKWQQLQ